MIISILPTEPENCNPFDGDAEIRGDFLVAKNCRTTDGGTTLVHHVSALQAIDSLSISYITGSECRSHSKDRPLARLEWRTGGEEFYVFISRDRATYIARWHRMSLQRVSK